MINKTVMPLPRTRAVIQAPGDKSISHRAAILNAAAEGSARLTGFLNSADCLNTLKALQAMAVPIETEGETVKIQGVGLRGFKPPARPIDVGNSGTGIRLLSGLCAGQPFETTLTGDESIRRRPMGRIVEPLRRMGAQVNGAENGNRAPLRIRGGQLRGMRYTSPVASAQVKSAVLIAGLYADSPVSTSEPHLSRDHTERMLSAMGADLERDGLTAAIRPGADLQARNMRIPADLSSAAFLIAAGVLMDDAEIAVVNVGVNPTRTGFLEALQRMGADIEIENERMEEFEPTADIRARSGALRCAEFGGDIVVRMIDEMPILALCASQAEGRTVVREASELRVKESDRISAIVEELGKLGVQAEERADGFVIEGPQEIQGGVCSSRGDHRMAMTGAVAGLLARRPTTIQNVGCVDTSFPGFWELLESLS